MAAIDYISSLRAQLDQAHKASESAKRSYQASCTEDEPYGCYSRECEWDNAAYACMDAQERLDNAGSIIKAALMAL